jgi:putative endonuclease
VTGSSEQAVAEYLTTAGFRLVDRNWRCPDGQNTIVAADRNVLVACEVTTRSGDRHGTPLEPVGQTEQARLRHLAARWLTEHGRSPGQIRVDVIGLTAEPSDGYTIEHIRGAA